MQRTLRPGLLVSLHTRLSGGVSYRTRTIEAEHTIQDNATRATWQTTKVTMDADEHKRAVLARASARNKVTAACRITDFGLLCPEADEAALMQALEEARTIAQEFNTGARFSSIQVYAVIGRIAADDVEATRAIASEISRACEAMAQACRAADPTAIREAANRARTLGAMLDVQTAKQLDDAIAEARANARELVKRVGKAGEDAAFVAQSLSLAKLEDARMSFLDIEDNAAQASMEIAAAAYVGRTVEDEASEPSSPALVAPTADIEV